MLGMRTNLFFIFVSKTFASFICKNGLINFNMMNVGILMDEKEKWDKLIREPSSQ